MQNKNCNWITKTRKIRKKMISRTAIQDCGQKCWQTQAFALNALSSPKNKKQWPGFEPGTYSKNDRACRHEPN